MRADQHRFKYLITVAFLLGVAVFSGAQEQAFKEVQEKFRSFSKQASPVKIYLHTDKDLYLAGEIIWFKLYYVDAASLLPLVSNRIAYVEVTDRSNKPVLQAKITLTGRGGSGSFYLPVSLVSDNYIIRAYTSDMRTGDKVDFFEKPVGIVNTVKLPEAGTMRDTARVIAGFFPEGGNLVKGIETKLAFRIADQDGKGVSASGIITDETGDTVQSFATKKFGIGSFSFKPGPAHSYRAAIQLPGGRTFTTVLPPAYEHGYVMNITDNKDGRFRITIQAKGQENSKRGENVFLLAHARQVTSVAEAGFVNYESDLVFFIDKSRLTAGVNHFTLFNKDRQPVCERLVFIRPQNKVQVHINSDKSNYQARQLVNINVSGDAAGGESRLADYSVAVFKVDSLVQLEQENLGSYLLLTSDLKGTVESPSYYFSNDPGVDEAVDDLLLTQGWRRFRWEDVLSKNASIARPAAQQPKGLLITARVTAITDRETVAGVECFLSCPGAPYGFYMSKTNDHGIVQFDVSDYYGPGEIIIQAGRDTSSKYRVDIMTPFDESRTERRLPVLLFKKEQEPGITTKSIAMQAQNIYLVDSIGKFRLPEIKDTLPFYGVPEYSYALDEYKRFTTMEEVLREYVRPVNVVLRNGNLYMRVFDELYYSLFNDGAQSVYGDNTLVLMDGVPLMNYNKVFSYDPLKIRKLDVVPRRYMIGGISFKGIVSFESYKGKFDAFELTPGVVAIDYEGLQLRREFYSPVYETNEQRLKRVPDFRSTLYWTPQVPVDKNGQGSLQFYTSDLGGKFIVVLQGFNTNGEIVHATTSFTSE